MYVLAINVFGGKVNVTTEGKQHIAAAIGSKDYKDLNQMKS